MEKCFSTFTIFLVLVFSTAIADQNQDLQQAKDYNEQGDIRYATASSYAPKDDMHTASQYQQETYKPLNSGYQSQQQQNIYANFAGQQYQPVNYGPQSQQVQHNSEYEQPQNDEYKQQLNYQEYNPSSVKTSVSPKKTVILAIPVKLALQIPENKPSYEDKRSYGGPSQMTNYVAPTSYESHTKSYENDQRTESYRVVPTANYGQSSYDSNQVRDQNGQNFAARPAYESGYGGGQSILGNQIHQNGRATHESTQSSEYGKGSQPYTAGQQQAQYYGTQGGDNSYLNGKGSQVYVTESNYGGVKGGHSFESVKGGDDSYNTGSMEHSYETSKGQSFGDGKDEQLYSHGGDSYSQGGDSYSEGDSGAFEGKVNMGSGVGKVKGFHDNSENFSKDEYSQTSGSYDGEQDEWQSGYLTALSGKGGDDSSTYSVLNNYGSTKGRSKKVPISNYGTETIEEFDSGTGNLESYGNSGVTDSLGGTTTYDSGSTLTLGGGLKGSKLSSLNSGSSYGNTASITLGDSTYEGLSLGGGSGSGLSLGSSYNTGSGLSLGSPSYGGGLSLGAASYSGGNGLTLGGSSYNGGNTISLGTGSFNNGNSLSLGSASYTGGNSISLGSPYGSGSTLSLTSPPYNNGGSFGSTYNSGSGLSIGGGSGLSLGNANSLSLSSPSYHGGSGLSLGSSSYNGGSSLVMSGSYNSGPSINLAGSQYNSGLPLSGTTYVGTTNLGSNSMGNNLNEGSYNGNVGLSYNSGNNMGSYGNPTGISISSNSDNYGSSPHLDLSSLYGYLMRPLSYGSNPSMSNMLNNYHQNSYSNVNYGAGMLYGKPVPMVKTHGKLMLPAPPQYRPGKYPASNSPLRLYKQSQPTSVSNKYRPSFLFQSLYSSSTSPSKVYLRSNGKPSLFGSGLGGSLRLSSTLKPSTFISPFKYTSALDNFFSQIYKFL